MVKRECTARIEVIKIVMSSAKYLKKEILLPKCFFFIFDLLCISLKGLESFSVSV